MITSFDDAFAKICGIEGDYSDNPADPGGPTRYGIKQSVARAHGYTGDMRNLPFDLAKRIAKSEYWDKFQCDQFDPRIGYLVFDAAYNGGHPIQWLQAAVKVTVDGIIGAQTVAAVRSVDSMHVMVLFNAAHLRYYASLKNCVMDDGWMNRVAFNLEVAAS